MFMCAPTSVSAIADLRRCRRYACSMSFPWWFLGSNRFPTIVSMVGRMVHSYSIATVYPFGTSSLGTAVLRCRLLVGFGHIVANAGFGQHVRHHDLLDADGLGSSAWH